MCALPMLVSAQQASTPAQPSRSSEATSLQGMKVAQIDFQGLVATIPQVHLNSLVQQTVGAPLDRIKIRDSIKALYATGRFMDIEVVADPAGPGEIKLTFVFKQSYFVGAVSVDGFPKSGPNESQMANASKLQLGYTYSTEKVDQAVTLMLQLLQEYGYYHAAITHQEVAHPETQQMDVSFHVTPGERARVGTVAITGNSGFSAGQIEDIGKIHPHDWVRFDIVSRALQRLRKKYQKRDRLEAQIALRDKKYNPAANTVDYTFEVDRGPTVDVEVEGASLSSGQLKKFVPVFEENAVDSDLLNEGRRNIRDYLQSRGYFDAKIQVKENRPANSGKVHIIYDVDKGERQKLTGVSIEGNKYFGRDTIRERMIVQPASMLLSHGRFSQSALARDVQSITNLYQSNGFENVKVSSDVLHNQKKGQMSVAIKIAEGQQTRVHFLTIEGNKAYSDEVLLSKIDTSTGQPFSPAIAASDRDTFLNFYYNNGFPDVQFQSEAKPHNGDPTKVDVTYNIKEGPRVFINRVLVSGLEFTRPYIVDREIEVKPGQPLSQEAMLNSQRRLYDLGIFNVVDMAVQNPDGAATYKTLLYNIKEAKRYTFNYGFGFEFGTGANQAQGTSPQGKTGISPRVSFDVTRINFRGRDQSIIFKSRLGELERRALLSFDSPRWLDLPNWRLTFTTFYDNSRDVNTFASERLEGSAQLTEVLNKASQLLYRFSYRRVKVDPSSFPAGFSPDLIPLYSRPVRVGMPSLTYIQDRRDDPVNSTKGVYNTLDMGVASGYFGSEADFGRILAQNSTYYRFGKGYVFARSLRIGVEMPYGNSNIIPLPERFFAGGSNSLRGFAINQAGPRDPATGSPLGGNAMIINNFELRLPPTPLPFVGNNVSFVLFHDMGNVFATSNEMWHNLWRFSQRHKDTCKDLSANSTCDFNYMSQAVGGGIRYKTPIGPVRVDLGYNLNAPIFPIKQASTGVTPHYEQLKRFNFFFSIGQTF